LSSALLPLPPSPLRLNGFLTTSETAIVLRALAEPINLADESGAREKAMPGAPTDDSPDSDADIEIRLGRPQQLFNSFDPSPFHERDLDEDAEAYIVDSVDEFPLQKRLRLIIHLPADQLPSGNAPDLPQAIHNYFAYRLRESQRRLKLFFRNGRIALFIGLAFLFACIILREFAFAFGHGAVAEIAGEGLLIIGWVAMWRPLEIFLYDWRPIRRRCQLFAKLSTIPVIVRVA
jgi:hypothetical protein